MSIEQIHQAAGQLTSSDVIRFSYFHFLRRFWVIVVVILLFSLFGLFAVLLTGDPERLQNPGSFYLMGLGIVFLNLGYPYVGARIQYSRRRYLREPMRFYFTPERVRLEGANFSGEMTWALVHSVCETKAAFLIYQTSQTAWILPKRFFWGEDRRIQECRQFIKQHLTKPTLFRGPMWLGNWF